MLLSRLDSATEDSASASFIVDSRETIRRHLADNQGIVRDLQDRLRRSQEDLELQEQQKDQLEQLLSQRDAAYDKLIGTFKLIQSSRRHIAYQAALSNNIAQRSAEFAGADEIKAQFEAQYTAKQSILEGEGVTLRKRLNAKEEDIGRLQGTIDEQLGEIDDLRVSFLSDCYKWNPDTGALIFSEFLFLQQMLYTTTSGIDHGREYAQATQELERTRRAAEQQQSEFEVMKRNLMRDVTDRCEKVNLSDINMSPVTPNSILIFDRIP